MSSSIRSYRDLIVWQRAMDLAVDCIEIGGTRTRRGGAVLMNQLTRAAVSIPANVAESAGRASRLDFLRVLGIANGSLKELETHLILIERTRFAPTERVASALALADEVGRLLTGLRRSLRAEKRS